MTPPDHVVTRMARTDERSFALLSGVAVAAWLHTATYNQPDAAMASMLRWPMVAAGAAAMLIATVRPLRWMVVAAWTALPTTLMSCYFAGAALAQGRDVTVTQGRLALGVAVASLIGGIVGRVAGGIREGT